MGEREREKEKEKDKKCLLASDQINHHTMSASLSSGKGSLAETERCLKRKLTHMEHLKQIILQQLSALQREEVIIEEQLTRARRRHT